MFGFGILDYIKTAVVVVILGICSFYVYSYHHMKSVVAAQKVEIDNLKEGQRVLTSKQEEVDKFITKTTQAKRKVTRVEDKVDTVPSTPDPHGDALVLDLLKPYRMRDDKIQHPSIRGEGSVKSAPRPKANSGPN